MAGKINVVRRERDKKAQPAPVGVPAALSAPKLDRLIHERLRLGILSALSVNQSLTFNELKKLLDTTDGNLSVHARKLEEAAYVACTKSFEGRVPRTEYRLTAAGGRRWNATWTTWKPSSRRCAIAEAYFYALLLYI
jgi:DNA-binding HxlR family transcriptional regulator